MFHRRFPELKISSTTILRIYKKHGIHFKFINRIKKYIDFTIEYYANLFNTMYQLLSNAQQNHIKVIYIDEAVFTFNTFKTKSWSSAYSSIEVRDANIKVKAHALVCGISEDKGYEHSLINLKSISSAEYITFLE